MRCCLCDEGLTGLPESIEPPQRQPSPVEFIERPLIFPARAQFAGPIIISGTIILAVPFYFAGTIIISARLF